MKNIVASTLLTLLMSFGVYANPLVVQGVSFPQGPISFADEVVEYRVGNGSNAPFDKPNAVIALPNGNVCRANSCPSFSLGKHGFVSIKFNDNYLTTSGDSSDDLWVFEVGEVVESTAVDISTDGKHWISVGKVEGATSGIDIDAYKVNGVVDDTKYHYVKLTDLKGQSGAPYRGADIDAIAAISAATSQVRKLIKEIEESKFVDFEVNFEGDHWRLTNKAKSELDKLGEALSSYALRQGSFKLVGHIAGIDNGTNYCYQNKSDYRYNEKCYTYMQWADVLSEGRANSVKTYLEGNYPISSTRLKASGLGNSDHKYPNDPWHSDNKRVEVKYAQMNRQPIDKRASVIDFKKPSAVDIGVGGVKKELMAQGERVYNTNCAGCHKKDGSGMPPVFPPMKGSPIANGIAADHMNIVLNGKGAMPQFKMLDDVDLAAVITYERNAFGNTGSVVQPSDVKSAR